MKTRDSIHFGSMDINTGSMQRRGAGPLYKDDTDIHELLCGDSSWLQAWEDLESASTQSVFRKANQVRKFSLNAGSTVPWTRVPDYIEKKRWNTSIVSLCFLTVGAMWPAISPPRLPCHEGRHLQTVSQNKSFPPNELVPVRYSFKATKKSNY